MLLFVPEEEPVDVLMAEVEVETTASPAMEVEDDDPVVESYPISVLFLPRSTDLDSLLVQLLQYPGRPHTRPYTVAGNAAPVQARLKPALGVVGVEVSYAAGRFFNASRADEMKVESQRLTGVAVASAGLYAACFDNGRVVLVPLERTSQMRPLLEHLDEMKQMRLQQERPEPERKPKDVVVQMSVRSTHEPVARFGGCVSATRRFDEEEWVELEWVDEELQQAEEARQAIFRAEGVDVVRESAETVEQYWERVLQ